MSALDDISADELIWPDPDELDYCEWRYEEQTEMTDDLPPLKTLPLRQLLDRIADECRNAGLLR
jgi:hypothetical protein